MRRTLIVLILTILMAGCSSKQISSGEPSARPAVPGKTTENNIIFHEQEPDRMYSLLTTLIEDYNKHLVQAINSNDFKYVAPELMSGSELDTAQRALIKSLSARNITEKYISSEVYNVNYVSPQVFEVEVSETTEIHYPDQGTVTKEFQWIYTAERIDKNIVLSNIRKWSTFAKDIEERERAVKADGYYASELLDNYPAILENSLNTLDITDLRRISANEPILDWHKQWITALRRLGTDFILEMTLLNPDEDDYSYEGEWTVHYVDKAGVQQIFKHTYQYKIQEVMQHFSGTAVISSISESP